MGKIFKGAVQSALCQLFPAFSDLSHPVGLQLSQIHQHVLYHLGTRPASVQGVREQLTGD